MSTIDCCTIGDFKFEKLTLDNVWRIVRKKLMDVSFLNDDECPVAYITNGNYFDIFNVFVERRQNPTVAMNQTYRYLCRLSAIIKFPEEKLDQVRNNTAVSENNRDQTTERNPDILLHLKNEHPSIAAQVFSQFDPLVDKEIKVEINGLRKFTTISNWSKQTMPTIDKEYPGLTKRDKIMIISEVVVANQVELTATYTFPEGNKTRKWALEGPVIIAFGATDLQLQKLTGKVVNEEPVPRHYLLSRKFWIHKTKSIQCNFIKDFLQDNSPGLQSRSTVAVKKLRKYTHGHIYDMACPTQSDRTNHDEGIASTSSSCHHDTGTHQTSSDEDIEHLEKKRSRIQKRNDIFNIKLIIN